MSINDLRSVENKLKKCSRDIANLKRELNKEMNQVKKASSTLNNSIKKSLSFPRISLYTTATHIRMQFNGEIYNVVNSPNMSLMDLYEFIKKYKLDQSRSDWDDACLQIAETYGRRLFYPDYDISGKAKSDAYRVNQPDTFISGSNNYWDDNIIKIQGDISKNDAKNQVLDILYEELSQGKPCVVQVEQHQKDGTIGRHYVTVVGIKESTTKDGVTENDFLILDPGGGIKELGDDRHIYAASTNPNESYCRVLTLIDEEGVIDNVNKARKEKGYSSEITELKS